MNPRNMETENPTGQAEAVTEEENIASSSTIPNRIGSSSEAENPTGEAENIGSSSTIPNRIGSSSEAENPTGEAENIGSSSNPIVTATSSRIPGLMSIEASLDNHDERTIINPGTGHTYFLENEIGSYYNRCCLVYKAHPPRFSWNILGVGPYSYVALKIIDSKTYVNESDEIRRQAALRLEYNPDANVIGVHAAFPTARGLFCVSLPYMSEGSLRYILNNRPDNRLPEHLIFFVLRVVLLGLRDELHGGPRRRSHKTLNVGDVFVHIDDVTGKLSIKLAYETSVYHSEDVTDLVYGDWENYSSYLDPRRIYIWGAAPEVFRGENADMTTPGVGRFRIETEGDNVDDPRPDIWLLGMMALELAYGNLPVKNREELNYIIKKLRESNKFPKSLQKLLSKRDGKFKKVVDFVKPKKRAFSMYFEKMVLACLGEDPVKRPTARELLDAPFFVTDIERFKQFVTRGNNPAPAHDVAAEELIEN